MRFKVLEGKHIEGGHNDGKGNRVPGTVYSRGDVVETKDNLLRFNSGARRPKFEKLDDAAPITQQSATPQAKPSTPHSPAVAVKNQMAFATLESMSVAELQKYCEGEEIDLGRAKSKDEILKVIKATL